MVNSVEINNVGILHMWPGANRAVCLKTYKLSLFLQNVWVFNADLWMFSKGVLLIYCTLKGTVFFMSSVGDSIRHLHLTDVTRLGEADRSKDTKKRHKRVCVYRCKS